MHVTGDGDRATIDTTKFVKLPTEEAAEGRKPKFKMTARYGEKTYDIFRIFLKC